MTKNRTPTPVYLDPGMHPGLEVKGLTILFVESRSLFTSIVIRGIQIGGFRCVFVYVRLWCVVESYFYIFLEAFCISHEYNIKL